MDLISFKERVKHGRLDLHPKLIYGFEDPDAGPYFKACGWAIDVPDDKEPDVVVTMGELDIDPLTVWGTDSPDGAKRRGQFVMPDRAAASLREQGHKVTDEWAENYVATFVPGNELVDHLKAEGALDA
jgi:hypothetical protein